MKALVGMSPVCVETGQFGLECVGGISTWCCAPMGKIVGTLLMPYKLEGDRIRVSLLFSDERTENICRGTECGVSSTSAEGQQEPKDAKDQ